TGYTEYTEYIGWIECTESTENISIILNKNRLNIETEDIQDIIKAKNSMKRASEAMDNKYKISSRRVYQIWRGVHPQIDPKDINRFLEEPDSPQQADPVECNVISGSKLQ
ncbi:17354_t:CDS:2, partial [Cetraspora pellucida]